MLALMSSIVDSEAVLSSCFQCDDGNVGVKFVCEVFLKTICSNVALIRMILVLRPALLKCINWAIRKSVSCRDREPHLKRKFEITLGFRATYTFSLTANNVSVLSKLFGGQLIDDNSRCTENHIRFVIMKFVGVVVEADLIANHSTQLVAYFHGDSLRVVDTRECWAISYSRLLGWRYTLGLGSSEKLREKFVN